MRTFPTAVTATLAAVLAFSITPAAEMTVEQRFEIARALAVAGSRPLLPGFVLDRRIRTSLRQSIALETIWQERLTAEQLNEELARIARETKRPDRLREMFRVLDDDPFLAREGLARAVLADRLIRERYAWDAALHREARHRLERARDALARDPAREPPPGIDRVVMDSDEDAPATDIVEETAHAFLLRESLGDGKVAVYSVAKRPFSDWWRENEAAFDESQLVVPTDALTEAPTIAVVESECSPLESWSPIDETVVVESRREHSAVWTGTEMIVWGGASATTGARLGTGGRYDPVLDAWTAISIVGAPSARAEHTAVWTGSEMIVWGGTTGVYEWTGGRYDPLSDSWTATALSGAPGPRIGHSAVWTGSRMIVWGGSAGGVCDRPLGTGGEYDPATDTWTPLTTNNAPQARSHHTAVWTGIAMIVWGGVAASEVAPLECEYRGLADGASIAPSGYAWTTITAAPIEGRARHSAVLSGTKMLVWGGTTVHLDWGSPQQQLDDGAIYDRGTWRPIPAQDLPGPRYGHTAVWTGGEMIVWGGLDDGGALIGGARYAPATLQWSQPITNDTTPRDGHTAVWTGEEMLVWGPSDGAIYRPPDPDADLDGICFRDDNCPDTANADQTDTDGDLRGDACDPCPLIAEDADGDFFCAEVDNCAQIFNPDQQDADADGLGDPCDICPAHFDPGQEDGDGDAVGDVCDNCPATRNSGQEDADGDRMGDVCDNCMFVATTSQRDDDGDGAGNPCDICPTGRLDRSIDAVECYGVWYHGLVLTPDGATAVYTCGAYPSGESLFSTDIASGNSTPLFDVSGESVGEHTLTRDGATVLYTRQVVYPFYDLWAVPVDGGESLLLSGVLPPDGYVRTWENSKWLDTPDGHYVVFMGQTASTYDLYAASLTDGNGTKLNPELASGGDVIDFDITGDSTRVVYVADQDTDNVREMYAVPVSGGPSTKISPPLVAGGNVGPPIGFSADDSRVVFVADAEVDSSFELYSAPVAGGTVVKLNAPLPAGGRVWEAEMSPDGSTVIYRAEQEVDNVFELYAVPVVGGTPVSLSGQSDPPGTVREFAISPDGARVVYRREIGLYSDALYSVPVGGGIPARLAGPPETGSIENYEITPDSTRVVYRARGAPGGQIELFSVPIDGGAPVVRLNATLIAGQSVTSFAVTPDSTRVVYRARHSDDWHVWLVPIAGGVPARVSAPLGQGGLVEYLVARNGEEIIYVADQVDTGQGLYAAPLGPNGDGDQVIDSCDCAPGDGGAFDIPNVVSGLHVLDALATLSWTSNAVEEAGDGTVYDVLRGLTDELPVGTRHSDETCAQPGVAGLSWTDGEIPVDNRAYYYLVRPRNSCGEGSYGQGSSGMPRDSRVCP